MSALLRSELLKLRTTRAGLFYPVALAGIAGLAAAGSFGAGVAEERGTVQFQADLIKDAGIAPLFALILGMTIVTNEFRHGTITATLLVSPVRERVVAAKAIGAALVGFAFALFNVFVIGAVVLPWLAAIGDPAHVGAGEVWRAIGRVLLAAALSGVLGAAVGALVHSQVAALVGTLVWLLLGEHIAVALLGLVDADGVSGYLPGTALNGLVGSSGQGEPLGFGGALGMVLAYIAAIGALGVLRTNRRDVT